VRSRLISARETARLMGLDESYKLPKNYNEAYHLTGDGVAVQVVRHLAEQLLEPLIGVNGTVRVAAWRGAAFDRLSRASAASKDALTID
jgi:DNA (cytosine-5)-methyltransferase 1